MGALEALDDEIVAFGGSTTLVPCDLADFEALDRLGAALYERFGRLDALACVGGQLGPLSPLGHVEPKDWETLLAVNLTANWRLLRSLDPLLRGWPRASRADDHLGRGASRAAQALLGTLRGDEGGASRRSRGPMRPNAPTSPISK